MATKKKSDFDVNRFTGTAEDTARGKMKTKKGKAAQARLNQMLSGKKSTGLKKK